MSTDPERTDGMPAMLAEPDRMADGAASCAGARLAREMLLLALGGGRLQAKIKADPGERIRDPQRFVALGVRHRLERHDQVVARGKCEVIVDEGIARDVDLRRQGFGPRSGDQEMNVRGPISMTPQRRKQFGGRAVGWYRITRGQKAAKPIRTAPVHADASA